MTGVGAPFPAPVGVGPMIWRRQAPAPFSAAEANSSSDARDRVCGTNRLLGTQVRARLGPPPTRHLG